MKKDKTIIDFIRRLKLNTNFVSLEIVDYWEADLCAIGIKKGDKLVYVSTYNYLDEEIKKYDYDLELKAGWNENKIEVVKSERGVYEEVLVARIKEFLQV